MNQSEMIGSFFDIKTNRRKVGVSDKHNKIKEMERFFMKEKSKGKKILELLQENYEIESEDDLSHALKDLFKDS